MKNRIKNLFIAGLMLASMGLATVVQAETAWGIAKMVTYRSECDALGGTIKTQVNGQYLCEYSNANATPSDDGSGNDPQEPGNNKNGGNKSGDGSSSTTIKQNGEYSYTGGLQTEDELETSIIDCGNGSNGEGIFCLLNIGLTVLTWGVGIAGTLGIVITGVQYITARDSVEQMTKAKNRLVNIIIGLVVYAVMWGFLNWLIPGGLF